MISRFVLATPLRAAVRRPKVRFNPTVGLLGLFVLLASPIQAQSANRFDSGILVSGAWLQANALPLERDAMHSAAIDATYRWDHWSAEAGFLRIARDFSTVRGGSGSFGRVFRWKTIGFIPSVGLFAGQSMSSRDTTGYDWVSGTTSGHTPRYGHSEGASFGGGVGLTIEVPVFWVFALRGTASEWAFTGTPLEGDRTRGLLGGGLVVRVGR